MIMSHNKTLLDGSYLMVSVSKFGIDTTENPWYRIGIVSIRKSWYRPSLLPTCTLGVPIFKICFTKLIYDSVIYYVSDTR